MIGVREDPDLAAARPTTQPIATIAGTNGGRTSPSPHLSPAEHLFRRSNGIPILVLDGSPIGGRSAIHSDGPVGGRLKLPSVAPRVSSWVGRCSRHLRHSANDMVSLAPTNRLMAPPGSFLAQFSTTPLPGAGTPSPSECCGARVALLGIRAVPVRLHAPSTSVL
jgi:hypothetical protein